MTNLLISQFNGEQKRFPVLDQDVVLLPLKGPMPARVRDRRLRQRVRRAHELSKCKGLQRGGKHRMTWYFLEIQGATPKRFPV